MPRCGWLVDPGRHLATDAPYVVRIGTADVDWFRAKVEMFKHSDNRIGGGHARQDLIQYLSSDAAFQRPVRRECRRPASSS